MVPFVLSFFPSNKIKSLVEIVSDLSRLIILNDSLGAFSMLITSLIMSSM